MVDYGMFFAYWARDWEADPAALIERITRASNIGFDVVEIHCDTLLAWDADERAHPTSIRSVASGASTTGGRG